MEFLAVPTGFSANEKVAPNSPDGFLEGRGTGGGLPKGLRAEGPPKPAEFPTLSPPVPNMNPPVAGPGLWNSGAPGFWFKPLADGAENKNAPGAGAEGFPALPPIALLPVDHADAPPDLGVSHDKHLAALEGFRTQQASHFHSPGLTNFDMSNSFVGVEAAGAVVALVFCTSALLVIPPVAIPPS